MRGFTQSVNGVLSVADFLRKACYGLQDRVCPSGLGFHAQVQPQGHSQSWEQTSSCENLKIRSIYASIHMGFMVVDWRYQEEAKVPPIDMLTHL